MKKLTQKIINILIILAFIVPILMNVVSAVDISTQTGSLTIVKSEVNSEGTSLLAGVTFAIYKIDDDSESTEIPAGSDPVASDTTLADGTVKFSDLELGRYLVVEVSAPANVVSKIANFIVDIPMTEDDGTTLNYDVTVYPKNNTVYGGIVLYKYDGDGTVLQGATFELQTYTDSQWKRYESETYTAATVLETDEFGTITLTGLPSGTYRFIELSTVSGYILDNSDTSNEFSVSLDETTKETIVSPQKIEVTNEKPATTTAIDTALTSGSSNIGDTVEYTTVIDVPSTIDNLSTYKLEITIPEGLTYDADSLTLEGVNDLESKALTAADYTSKYENGVLTITFTNANLTSYNTINVCYDAKLNDSADATTTGNTIATTLTYSDVVTTNYKGEANSETTATAVSESTVYTGGFWIEKRATNSTGSLLSGAVFKIATSEANAKAGTFIQDESGTDITITTVTDGTASYKGLAYGEYYLVEVQAPSYEDSEGNTKYYNLLNNAVEITVSATSYSSQTATAVVVNKKGFTLPSTGGIGTIIVIVVGVAFIVAGTLIYVKGRKEENSNN